MATFFFLALLLSPGTRLHQKKLHQVLDINKAHYSTCHIWYKNRYDGVFDHFLDLPTALGQILAEQQQGEGLEPPEGPLGTLYPPKKIILIKIIYG